MRANLESLLNCYLDLDLHLDAPRAAADHRGGCADSVTDTIPFVAVFKSDTDTDSFLVSVWTWEVKAGTSTGNS